MFGEIALLDGQPRTADASAMSDCELVVIERRDFVPFLHDHPEVMLKLIEILCSRLRRTSEQVEDVTFLNLPTRLAKTLLQLTAGGEASARKGKVTITQREISDIIGRSRESTNKQLRAWSKRGWIKLERGGASVDRARAIIRAGIPVMGHVGLTPQTATALGGYKAQGRTGERAAQIAEDAFALQAVGCFAIVFEAVPAAVTEAIMPRMEVPVIGIGAGGATDGQVLVFHDLLGINTGHTARFVKRYAEIHAAMVAGVGAYVADVRDRRFPEDSHTYSIDPDELESFRRYLEQDSLAGTSAWDW